MFSPRLLQLGWIAFKYERNPKEGRTMFETARKLADQVSLPVGTKAIIPVSQGTVALQLGDYFSAEKYFHEALVVANPEM
jgi:hypothetical protein